VDGVTGQSLSCIPLDTAPSHCIEFSTTVAPSVENVVKIGITYDLREEYLQRGFTEEETAEFDIEETIHAIEVGLAMLGHETQRIGSIQCLASRLTAGQRWDLVFNIAEGLNGFSRESQVPALLDAYDVAYTFSDPIVLGLTLHKGLAKHVVRDMGLRTPDFVVFDHDADLDGFSLPFPVFAKPVAGGSSMNISRASKVSEPQALLRVCRELRGRAHQPVLVECFLPGREFTVGVVGTGSMARAIGALEILLQPESEPEIYSYTNKRDYQRMVRYRLADDGVAGQVTELALCVWRRLNCQDAGRVDVRLDAAGTPSFLEVNPIPGLHPEHSDLVILCRMLGIRFKQLLEMILDSATERRPNHLRRTERTTSPQTT
jgi:D-alanine-D-alanine ligase